MTAPLLSQCLRRSFLRPAQTLARRSLCTLIEHEAVSSASFERALPLAFISAPAAWQPTSSSASWSEWINKFSSSGFTCLECRLDFSEGQASLSVSDQLEELEKDLTKALSTPFPPMLLAHQSGILIAEKYVASHPLAGMLLLDAPPEELEQQSTSKPRYEPFFPIALMGRPEQSLNKRLQEEYGDYVDVLEVGEEHGLLGAEAGEVAHQWIDEVS